MSKDVLDFSEAMVKVAKESSSYLNQMVAFAPAAVIQSTFDIPKGSIDKGVENRLNKMMKVPTPSSEKKISSLRQGLGRGAGRLSAALVTTPLFLGGIRDLSKAKNKKDRNAAFGKVVAAGGLYSVIKGGVEAGTVYGSPFKKDKAGKFTSGALLSQRKLKGIPSVRGVLGIGSAALTAAAISKGIKKKDKKSFYNDVVKPALAGFTIGGAKGAIEKSIVDKTLKIKPIISATAGRGAAGAVGALVLDRLAKSMKKTASTNIFGGNNSIPNVISRENIYSNTKEWAQKRSTEDVRREFLLGRKENPESSPSKRAEHYALYDELRARGENPPKPKNIDNIVTKQSNKFLMTTGILGASISPEAINVILNRVPRDKVDDMLKDSLDNIIRTNGYQRIEFTPKNILDESSGIHPKEKIIYTPKNVRSASMAHEIGHISKNPLRRELLQTMNTIKAYKAGRLLSYLVPVGAIALSSDPAFLTKKELESKKDFINTVNGISRTLMAPLLLEEGLTHKKGLEVMQQAAKKSGISSRKATINYILRQTPKAATYLAPLIAGAMTSNYYANKVRERNQ